MTWFKIDDSFYDHPKVWDAPDCAVALWVRAGTWSARNLTDGFVPNRLPARFCDDPETAVRELLQRGLWSRVKGGYQFHDWTDYQPSRESVEKERRAAAERKRRQRARQKAQASGDPVTGGVTRDSRVSHMGSHGGSPPSPTRPDPTRPISVTEGGELTVSEAPARPPQTCPQHPQGTTTPCGPCKDARLAYDRWAAAKSAREREAPRCRRHRGQPRDHCGPCRSEQLAAHLSED